MTETRQGNLETADSAGAAGTAATADRELIDRYLANRLSNEERELIETRIVVDPEFRHEAELTEALRDGLRQLEKQGRIAPLLTPGTPSWRHPSFALAASVIVGLLAAVSLLLYQRLDQTRQELSAAAGRLSVSTPVQATRTQTLRFQATRGGQGVHDVTWQRLLAPTLLELRFDVGLEPVAGYTAVIERVALQGNVIVLAVPYIGIDVSGEIAINIHSAMLAPGDYRVRLEPHPTATLDHQPVTYSIRVGE